MGCKGSLGFLFARIKNLPYNEKYILERGINMEQKEPVNIIEKYKEQQKIKRKGVTVKIVKGALVVTGIAVLASALFKKEAE
jgi:glutamine amidotransferase-like uncharacterized protein